jgi:hypothetical protein
MNSSSVKQQDCRPHNVGTSYNLPEEVRARLGGASSSVIAWTALDEEYEPTLGQTTCCVIFGPLLVLPCFWPLLIPFCPCLCMAKVAAEIIVRNTFWILTDQDVKILVRSANYGCYKSGDNLKSIPLSQITDCGIQAPAQGCFGDCVKSIPSIYIDTASVREAQRHEVEGYGMAGYDWFVAAILRQRDQGRATPITAIATPMERGDPETVERRLEQISNLLERGVLTKDEYEKKRQEIVASI